MTSQQVLGLSPEEILKLNSRDIPSLVSAAIEFDRASKQFANLLSVAKERLVQEARRTLADGAGLPDEAGTSATFNSDAGEIARVNFPKPSLIRGFWIHKDKAYKKEGKGTVEIGDVKAVAGDFFDKLFAKVFRPGTAFRDLCRALLPPGKAAKLMAMMEEPSSPRVSFETTEGQA
jgi:hypothetical protein